MNKLFLVFILTIAALSFLIRSVNALSPLHTEGKYIKDEFGNIVYLRGTSKSSHIGVPGGFWHPEDSMNDYGIGIWSPDAVTYNLGEMKDLGINTLKLFLPEVGRWLRNQDTGGIGITPRDEIAYVINEANKSGIYVLLSPWAIDNVYDPQGGQTAIPWDYYTDPETGITYGGPGVFTNPAEQGVLTSPEDFIDYWAGATDSISAEYGHFPNILYDLWNEPNGWLEGFNVQEMYFNVCQDVIDALRAKGDEHIVVYQFGFSGTESNQALEWGQNLTGSNIVYSIHTYRSVLKPEGMDFAWHWWPNGEYQYSDVERILLGDGVSRTYYVQNIIDNNLPFINTEMGAIREQSVVPGDTYENEVTWYSNMLTCFNNWESGYINFEWYSTERWFGMLESNYVYPWRPPVNAAGQALVDAIAEGSIKEYLVNITGIVTDSESGETIQGATVSCAGYSSTTNSTGGYFIMIPLTAPGSCTLTASRTDSHITKSISFSFTENITYTGKDFVLDPIKYNIAGKLIDKNNNPVQADIIIYKEGSVVATDQTVDGDYSLSLSPDIYDIQFNVSNFYIKLPSVDLSSDITDIINYVTYSSDRLSFTTDIENVQSIQILSSKPNRILLNNSEIGDVSSIPALENNTWYHDLLNNNLYLKISPDLKSYCIFDCCKNELRYYDKACPTPATQYCLNRICNAKQPCPFECCVDEELYLDDTTACGPGEMCSDRTCVSTMTFGKTDVGGTAQSLYQYNIRGCNFMLPVDGTVTKVSVYITNTGSGNFPFSVLIYNSSRNFIARSEQTLALPLSGWYNFSFSQPLIAGVYNLAFWTSEGSGTTSMYQDTGTTGQSGLEYETYNSPPNPITWDSGTQNYNMSIYATYSIS